MQDSRNAAYLWIAVLGCVVYGQTLLFQFVYFDDNLVILDRLAFLSDFGNIAAAFQQDVFDSQREAYYRPVLLLSLMIDAHVAGSAPFIYHLTNLLLHLGASVLVFSTLRKLGHRYDVSLAASLLFVALPIHSQAVSWIMGRNDLLLTCFVLASFSNFLNYTTNRSARALAWHLAFFGAALFTKETAVALPLVCLAHWATRSDREDSSLMLGRVAPGWCGLPIMWWLARSSAFEQAREITGAMLGTSLAEAGPALIQLTGKLLFPFNLGVLPVLRDTTLGWGLLACATIGAVLIWTPAPRRRNAYFGVAWIVLFVAPTLLRTRETGVQHLLEHRMYLPSVGMLLVLLETPPAKRFHFSDRRSLAVLTVVLLCASAITLHHSRHFADRSAFWNNAVANSPNHPLAHRNQGAILFLEGDLDSAEWHTRRALELSPDEAMAHNNLGLIHSRRGAYEEAKAAFARELELHPDYADAYFNLATVYVLEQSARPDLPQSERALSLLERCLALDPDHGPARRLQEQLQARIETLGATNLPAAENSTAPE